MFISPSKIDNKDILGTDFLRKDFYVGMSTTQNGSTYNFNSELRYVQKNYKTINKKQLIQYLCDNVKFQQMVKIKNLLSVNNVVSNGLKNYRYSSGIF